MNTLSKLILATVAVPLLAGFFVNFSHLTKDPWPTIGILYAIGVIIVFSACLISQFYGKPNGVLTAIVLIILVLIPSAFIGTCSLGFGGAVLRSLFVK
ncbi:MAG: hypothetical protein WCI27_07735 [Candidatus Omnitrophota bacterium]